MEHQYWKQKIATHLRSLGYTVQEEYPIGEGKTVDLVVRKDGNRIAIEIETGKSDAVADIRKCIQAGFDEVVSVATSAHVESAVRKRLDLLGNIPQHVTTMTVHKLLERDKAASA